MLLILVTISCVFLNGISAFWFNNGPTTEVPSNISTPIRLVGGNYPWEGRVEIEYNGRWGTICDDMFDINDTAVLCRMLGHNDTDGSIEYYSRAHFGGGYGPILIDDLDCSGEEDDVSECKSTAWFTNNCNHGEDVSVNCAAGTKVTFGQYFQRDAPDDLLGRRGKVSFHITYDYEGYLEIFFERRWGYVCYNNTQHAHQFDFVCQSLGFSSVYNISSKTAVRHAIVTDFNCPSYSHSNGVNDCTGRNLGAHTYCMFMLYIRCDHSTTVAPFIKPSYTESLTTEGTVTRPLDSDLITTEESVTKPSYSGYPKSRVEVEVSTTSYFDRPTTAYVLGHYGNYGHLLFNLSEGSYGFLQIYYNGRWNHVCHSNNQYTNQFHSLCRYLGYFYAYRAYGQYDSRHSAIVTDFHCPPSNTYYYDPSHGIDDCTGTGFGKKNYCYEKLYIQCGLEDSTVRYEVTTNTLLGSHGHIPVRLTFGYRGFLQININGRWGYVCHNSSQSTYQFHSVCRSLGLPSAHYVYGRYDSSYTALVTDLQCPGNNYSSSNGIDDCTGHRLGYNTYCNDKLYIECDSLTTEETATVPFQTESTNAKHITVNCQHSSWYVKVHLPPMEQQYSDLKETDIYLGSHSCTGTRSGDYLIFNEDYTTCGTNKIASTNGVIYTNTLVYAVHDPNQPYIVHEYRFRVSVECDMSKQESGENNINNIHGNLEQQTISGVGHFVVQLKFFSDSNFQHEFSGFPPSYMVGQNVYVKATTPIHDYNVKMRLSDCYTKPSKSASDSYIYYLIQHGCPAAPSAFVTTKSTHETRFHFQDFEYAFHPHSMYVHCNATFCHTNDYSRDCEPRCSNRKRVGSIDQDDEPIEGVGPIGYAEDEATVVFQKGIEAFNAGKKPEVNNKGNNHVYVVGVVVVAVSMVAVLVVMSIYFRSKRRQNGQAKIV